MDTAQRLRQRREDLGFTRGQVEEYSGIKSQYLYKLETGANSPNVWPLLAALAKYYRCSTDYLLGLTDDPTPAGEVSEISALYERLSSDRQRDLLDIAENWLADESDEFALEWLKERLKKYERQGALDVFNTMLDEEYEDMESDESGAA